jgi:primosomal protein N' (replication factor Y)
MVIDESHDHSFKQEDFVNYQGRDMAIVRAKMENLPVILSTATPDLETMVNVDEGKYDCVQLKSRYANAMLPEIKVIDFQGRCVAKYMLKSGSNEINFGTFSEGLYFIEEETGAVQKVLLTK